MDARELIEWMSFDMASDKEFQDKTLVEQALEAQQNQTAEEEADKIRALFGLIK